MVLAVPGTRAVLSIICVIPSADTFLVRLEQVYDPALSVHQIKEFA